MHFNRKIIIPILFAIMFAGGIYIARGWPLLARLVPLAVGIPGLIFSLAELVVELRKRPEPEASDQQPKEVKKEVYVDFRFDEDATSQTSQLKAFRTFVWLVAFIVAGFAIGFSLGFSVVMFLYLKLEGKEGWVISVIFGLATWGFVWGIFGKLFDTIFPDPWIISLFS